MHFWGGCEPVSRETAASRRRTVLVLIRPVDGTPMYAGSILACGNGISRPPPGEVPLALRAMSTTWGSRSCSDAMDRSMSSTWRHASSASVGHGAVQQTTRLVHLDCDCTASASVPDVNRAEGIAESRLCRRSTDAKARRYAEQSGSLQQPGMRADRSEVMRGSAGLPIDRTHGRSGVAAPDNGGHRC